MANCFYKTNYLCDMQKQSASCCSESSFTLLKIFVNDTATRFQLK